MLYKAMYPVICVILVKQAVPINTIEITLQSRLILVERFRPPTDAIQWTLLHFSAHLLYLA